MRGNHAFVLALLCASLFMSSHAYAQDSSRTSLELPGCPIEDIAAGADPTSASFVVVAGCNSQIGLHYARSYGGEWVPAEGGDYSAGIVREVEVTSGGIFAIVNGALIRSDLPASASSFSPNWAEVSALSNPTDIVASGRYLAVISTTDVKVYDTETSTVVETESLPTGGSNFENLRLGANFVYLLGTSDSSSQEALFRNTFDTSTGAIGATWTDLASATGLDYDSNDDIWSFFVNPVSGDVFVAIRKQPEFTDLVYKSTDDGASYTSTGLVAAPNRASFSADGNTIILGLSRSTNGGSTWTTLDLGSTGDNGRLEDQGNVIDQSNADQALVTTNFAVALSSNLSAATPTWTIVSTGLQGTNVYLIDQSATNDNRVLLGTSGGLAVTDTFNSDPVSWTFPLCPGHDCVGGRSAFIDPTNDNQVYYGSGNIRRCDITDTASISCTDFASKPSNFWNFSVFRMFTELPNVLVAGYVRTEGATEGGLYFYDIDDPSSPTSPTELANIPIKSFLPLSSTVMFVGAGVESIAETAYRGVYQSSDGGASFSKMTDSDLPELVLINDFAYDSTTDLLYAAGASIGSESGTVYHLSKAAADGTDWTASTTTFTEENFTALTVDPANGDVYASSGAKIFKSSDGGVTFAEVLSGKTGETTSDLEAASDGSSESSGIHSKAATSRIVQASSIGVYALDESSLSCSLRIKGCSGKVAKGTKCKFKVSATDTDTNEGADSATFQLQRRKKSSAPFSNLGSTKSTNSVGRKTFTVKASKGEYRVVFTSPACTTNSKTIKIRR